MANNTNNLQGALPTMRLREHNNKKKRLFQDMGIEEEMSKSVSEVTDLKKKQSQKNHATNAQQTKAQKSAEDLRRGLNPEHPSFVITMLPSHVSGGFWLGLPRSFCKAYNAKDRFKVVLENENGSKYPVNYIGEKSGLSGGWKNFALCHKLDVGDAVVFELIKAEQKFKVYIFKACDGIGKVDTEETKYAGGTKILISETCEGDVVATTRTERKARVLKKAKKTDSKQDKRPAKPYKDISVPQEQLALERRPKIVTKEAKEVKKKVVKVKAVKYFRKRTKYCDIFL